MVAAAVTAAIALSSGPGAATFASTGCFAVVAAADAWTDFGADVDLGAGAGVGLFFGSPPRAAGGTDVVLAEDVGSCVCFRDG